jgi:hypothetical protein
MSSSGLAYSEAAWEVMPLFRKKHLTLFGGGAQKPAAQKKEKPGEEYATVKDDQESAPSSFIASTAIKKQRIPGLNRGTIKLSDDFDDPLPDEFWLGTD